MGRFGLGRQVSTEAFQAVTSGLIEAAASRRVALKPWLGRPALLYAGVKEMDVLLSRHGGNQGLAARLIQIQQQDAACRAGTLPAEVTPLGEQFEMGAKVSRDQRWFAVRAYLEMPDRVVKEAVGFRRAFGLNGYTALDHVIVNLAKGRTADSPHSQWLAEQTQSLLPAVVTLEPATVFPNDPPR